ncbi:hypothetical protein [Streptomyces sp. 5-10]|uniref:hypothetical protein n=1 Tax=Streptomyces sp. 5-10 TaxID=878925 RepID=UPI00168A422C|nr:hypothetical protein [Streptomyces sp. 5-10]MBD3004600.1 hypothetical protein [Streptomyces sp. 5-10]
MTGPVIGKLDACGRRRSITNLYRARGSDELYFFDPNATPWEVRCGDAPVLSLPLDREEATALRDALSAELDNWK